jgi:hypothetical protein
MVSTEPLLRPVHVLLPPSRPEAEENAQRVWNEQVSRKIIVKQLRKSDLANALLPDTLTGTGGQSVKRHHTWCHVRSISGSWRTPTLAECEPRRILSALSFESA